MYEKPHFQSVSKLMTDVCMLARFHFKLTSTHFYPSQCSDWWSVEGLLAEGNCWELVSMYAEHEEVWGEGYSQYLHTQSYPFLSVREKTQVKNSCL